MNLNKILLLMMNLSLFLITFMQGQLNAEEASCVVGSKAWEKEGVKVCDRTFLLAKGEGIHDLKFSRNHYAQWDCVDDVCPEPTSTYSSPEIIFLISFDGVSEGKLLNTKSSIRVTDMMDIWDKDGKVIGTRPDSKIKTTIETYEVLNKSLQNSPKHKYYPEFVLISEGALKKSEKYEVRDTVVLNQLQSTQIKREEIQSYPIFYELVKETTHRSDFSSEVLIKDKISIFRAYLSGRQISELIVDPEGDVGYSWHDPNIDSCSNFPRASIVTRVNGYLVIYGRKCDPVLESMPFMRVKFKGKYHEYLETVPVIGC